jgi:preprotein translocase subunit SecY
MVSAFANCLKVPELRNRILFTLSLLFIARVLAHIPLPGLDPTSLIAYYEEQSAAGGGQLLGLYNLFTGGALLKGAIGALGVMPYISAAIIFQLLAAVVPSLSRLQQEGDIGRQKITQYTRYATVAICVVQAALLVVALENPGRLFEGFTGRIVLIDHWWFMVSSVVFLTTGSLVMMWLGEQITQRGIGNGVSILITVGILGQLPAALRTTYQLFRAPVGQEASLGFTEGILMGILLLVVIAGMVAITQAQRKVPVQYAKRVVGRRVVGGASSFLPLKVNYSGVMPVIFAATLLMLPQQIFNSIGASQTSLGFLQDVSRYLAPPSLSYYLIKGLMILFFSYFWVSIMFKPIQIADDLKKYGGYVPGVRPGDATASFLDFIMTRLTLAGAIFLTAIAILPDLMNHAATIPYTVGVFFGGTGMLITVGVVLDTMRQVETFLLQRHYDGFLQKGRIKSRTGAGQTAVLGEALGSREIYALLVPVTILFVVGLVFWVLNLV